MVDLRELSSKSTLTLILTTKVIFKGIKTNQQTFTLTAEIVGNLLFPKAVARN